MPKRLKLEFCNPATDKTFATVVPLSVFDTDRKGSRIPMQLANDMKYALRPMPARDLSLAFRLMEILEDRIS